MSGFVRGAPRTVFEGRFRVVDYPITGPDGVRFDRQVTLHPGAVTVLAHTAGNIVLVRQYRASVDEMLLELPAGKLDPGEDPAACARRELEEETGLRPARVEVLSELLMSPGFCDEVMWLYLAEDLEPCAPNPQGAEECHMDVVHVPLAEAVAMVGDGRVRDAKSMLGILLAERRFQGG